MIRIFDDHGTLVAQSKNLRGVLTYARRHGVKRASVYAKEDNRGWIIFIFANGSTCRAEFESYSVACRWIAARRSWGLRLAGHNETFRDHIA